MKFLIVGLGNPGPEYEETRHNIGYKVLDKLTDLSGTFFESDKLAMRTVMRHGGKILILLKPSTYMNLSGKALQYWIQKEKIELENLLVITDDIALPLGAVRLRPRGSDGGHNGLRNIQETLHTDQYPRLRFGIGSDFARGGQVDYVLGHWTESEKAILPPRIDLATQAVISFCMQGLPRTMSEFNNR